MAVPRKQSTGTELIFLSSQEVDLYQIWGAKFI